MSSISDQKAILRKEILQKRSEVSMEQWEEISTIIQQSVLNLKKIKEAQTIHCYVSMNQRMEVNTIPLISEFLNANKYVFIPITNFETNSLNHSKLTSMNDLELNKWGVLEPKQPLIENPANIDIILVPLLAIDKKGNRLGYGKGFYDKFLSTTKALTLGLVFSDFVLDEIPNENFDVKLNGFISENEVRYL